MLYISRRVSIDTYGVYDTDDDSEQLVSVAMLIESAMCGVKVEGFLVNNINDSFFAPNIMMLRPFQPSSTLSTAQVKAKVLYGVSITVFRDEITCVRWDNPRISTPVRVRLSDFGTVCGYNMLDWNNFEQNDKAILIFDDKLSLCEDSLAYRFSRIGVIYDLCEVTRNDICQTVYNSLASHFGSLVNCSSRVRDNHERKSFFMRNSVL